MPLNFWYCPMGFIYELFLVDLMYSVVFMCLFLLITIMLYEQDSIKWYIHIHVWEILVQSYIQNTIKWYTQYISIYTKHQKFSHKAISAWSTWSRQLLQVSSWHLWWLTFLSANLFVLLCSIKAHVMSSLKLPVISFKLGM